MKEVIRYLRIAKPFLQFAGEELSNLDENTTGNDDRAAAAIVYVVRVIDAMIKGQTIPDAPDALR